VQVGAATDLAVEAAIRGTGVIYLFEDWLRPHSTAVHWSPSLTRGGSASQGPFSTIPADASCPHRCAPFVDFISSSADHL